jgi:sugar phosphate isomerase/epimerase
MSQDSISRVLWSGVVRRYSIAEQIQVAALAGFDKLTIPYDVYCRNLEAGVSARELLARATDSGLTLDFFDGFGSWLPKRYPRDAPGWIVGMLDCTVGQALETCATLGLQNIVALGYFEPGAFTQSELVDHLGRFCEQAQAVGVRVDLEFIPHFGIRTLSDAWNVVREVNRSSAGILLDTWHFMRSHSDMALLEAIPPETIVNLQLADGPLTPRGATIDDDAILYRQMPGEGELPILDILEMLLRKGSVRSVGPELFYLTDDRPKAEASARSAARTTEAIMAKAGYPLPFAPRTDGVRAPRGGQLGQ